MMINVTLLSTEVNPSSGWGNITYELCQEFLRRKDLVFQLHLPVGVPLKGDIDFSANVRQTLPPWIGSFRSRPHRLLPFLFPKIKLDKTDIIHTLIEFPYSIIADKLSQRAGIPFIITTHGTYGVAPLLHWVNRWVYKRALCRAAVVTAPSHFTAEAIRRVGGIEREIRVIHNAVNYARFQKQVDLMAIRKRFGLPADARVILGVGALKRRKSFDTLIKAFARVVHKEPKAWLVIVGKGPEESALANLAASQKVEGRVRFVGEVSGDDLVGLYQLCEVYSHLPRQEGWHFEGFGIVYLEAGACGKPVVATRSGGVTDAVLHGRTGLLVEEGDDEAAATAITRLLQDKDLSQSLGEAGRDYASRHTWSWYADQIVSLYREALQHK